MKKTLFISLVLIVAMTTQAQVLKLKKGQEYIYNTSLKGTITQSMAGQEMVMDMTGSGIQQYLVEEKTGENYTILGTMKLDSLILKSALIDSVFHPGSEAVEKNRYTLSKLGKTIHSQNASDKTSTGAASQMGFDVKQGVPVVPFQTANPKPGDTWSDSRTDSVDFMGGSLVINTKSNYTAVGITKHEGVKCLEVKLIADVINEGSTSMQGMEFFMEGTGKMAGNIFIDLKTGMMIEEEIVMENLINLALSGQQSMVIPISQKMTTRRVQKK